MPSWANRITRHFWATRCGVVPERTNDSSCALAASSTERAVAVGNMTRLNHDQAVLSIVMRDGTLVCQGVVFRRICSRVKHVEGSIGRGRQLEIVGGILGSREIGDEGFRRIVRRAALFGEMQLPQIFEVR